MEAYYNWIINCFLELRQIEEAEGYIRKMESVETNFVSSKQNLILRSKTDSALLLGEYDEALRYARKLNQRTEYLQNISAPLATYQMAYAKELLVQFIRKYRNSEIAIDRINACLYLGDYYYTLFRSHLGLPGVSMHWSESDQFNLRPKLIFSSFGISVRNRKAASNVIPYKEMYRLIRNARMAYFQALEIGEYIDHKLECVYYSEQVETRLSRLFQLYDVVGGTMEKKDFISKELPLSREFISR